jgi:hypothetical protein
MATLLKVLNNLADIKSAGGVALRVRTRGLHAVPVRTHDSELLEHRPRPARLCRYRPNPAPCSPGEVEIAKDNVAVVAAHQHKRIAGLDWRVAELVRDGDALAIHDVVVGE